MRILTVLTYYRPHTSGLTIYAERIAKAFVARGHQVTVLTSQYEKNLPLHETLEGVEIIRSPVLFRLNKGVIMPWIGWQATRAALRHDVILLHLPQFDAAGISLRGRLFKKPTIIAYHSDLILPPGAFNRFVNFVVDVANRLTATFAHRISAYTDDIATHSPYLSSYPKKVKVITPPVELPQASLEAIGAFRFRHNPEGKRIIGMATRFASEKGVEVLLDALPKVMEKHPNVKVLFAGQYEGVWGEQQYFERLAPRIRALEAQGKWKFLGVLPLAEMPAFFANLDVICVPSLNSTETFGFVQVEAMMNGVPSVASNLPGVRQPVQMTGMGEVIPIGSADGLARALIRILEQPEKYRGDCDAIRERFSPLTTAARYEALFEEIRQEIRGK
ncbi:MAG: glycosyltransferase family 4 protein [Anaerolineales bacterium]